jgi:L-histidine Nalpha-methyltransferase
MTASLTRQPSSATAAHVRDALISEVRLGVRARPRRLSPWMFYDANGSTLFERITHLPEYYVTRTERNILATFAAAIIATVIRRTRPLRVIELGAGTAAKTAILLSAVADLQDDVLYTPIDVSGDALDIARRQVASSVPGVHVDPVVANYVTHPPQLARFEGTTLALYLGSSIGNFSPDGARSILRSLRSQLRPGDALVLGTDLVKDESTLIAAYDDQDGITAAFNRNILHRLNREIGADFDPARFAHRAVWNGAASRIEMHLESRADQRVRIPEAGLDLQFSAFETIHTENSYKFTHETICSLVEDVGFSVKRCWTDSRGWYAITLAPVRPPSNTAANADDWA